MSEISTADMLDEVDDEIVGLRYAMGMCEPGSPEREHQAGILAVFKAIRAALLELDSLKAKYLTATDNLKSREAEVAELTDRHHIDLMELDAQMKSENASIQNAAKLAAELTNLKESSQFQAYEEIRLRLHDALRERDEWRDRATRGADVTEGRQLPTSADKTEHSSGPISAEDKMAKVSA